MQKAETVLSKSHAQAKRSSRRSRREARADAVSPLTALDSIGPIGASDDQVSAGAPDARWPVPHAYSA